MPNIIEMKAVTNRKAHGWLFSGDSSSPSSFGTPCTPIRYWKIEATASRNTTAAVRIALS